MKSSFSLSTTTPAPKITPSSLGRGRGRDGARGRGGGRGRGGDEGSAVVEQIPEFQEQTPRGGGFYGQFQV